MVFNFFFKFPAKYMLNCRLQGHRDAILCLAVSSSGMLLASGGFDGLRMWDLHKKVQLAEPPQIRSPQDPIMAIAWLVPNDGIQETLCCGTALGYLVIWRQRLNTVVEFEEVMSRRISGGHEIMAITSDVGNGTGNRIVVATQDRRVQAWTLDSRNRFSSTFSVQLKTSIPRAVYTHGCDVIVFRMYNGDIHILRSDDRMVIETRTTGMITCIRMYDTKPLKTYPKQVAFMEDGTVIVGGSNNGLVYIFKKNTGTLRERLHHSQTARAQTVTAYEGTDHMGILAASSNNDMDTMITVWKKPKGDSQGQQRGNRHSVWILFRAVWAMVQFLMQLLTMAFAVKLAYDIVVSHRSSEYLLTAHRRQIMGGPLWKII
ncbi:WD40-repeat-containing domain protein [Pisolithus microcarpus]|nr:WD40-repeat-containing domain protein [Pisolithus microcarpus]